MKRLIDFIPGGNFILQSLLLPIAGVLKAAYELFMFVFYLPFDFLFKLTPINRLIIRYSKDSTILKQLEEQARILVPLDPKSTKEGQFLTGKNLRQATLRALMVHGRHREAAELIAPASEYPSLYVDVPEDLRQSIVQDGRIVNGDTPAQALAGLALTPVYVESSWKSAVKVATRAAYTTLILGIALSVYVTTKSVDGVANVGFEGYGGQVSAAKDRGDVVKRFADVFSTSDELSIHTKIADASGKTESAESTRTKVASIVQAFLTFTLLLLGVILAVVATARITWIGRFRFLVFEAVNGSVDGLRLAPREAMQTWRKRLVERVIALMNRDRQIHFVTEIDKSPLIDIGEALGLMEFRGHQLGPQQSQPIRMSIVDMLQHIEVLGGSGEGKSRDVYVPLIKQLLNYRKQGYPIAVYGTDSKGAIAADVLEIAREIGLPEGDVIVVGTGPNDYRVDLLDGVSPTLFADVIKSVAAQAGGSAGDDFWPEMASDILLQCAVVLEAAECTAAGLAWVTKNDGIRMYSLLNILRVASSDDEISDAVNIVARALQDKDGEFSSIAHLDKLGLHAAIEYLSSSWLTMVDATKDGIRANARKSLRAFAFKAEISEGFADGKSERLISASELHSNRVKLINIGNEGQASRLVAIMLKTLFYQQAMESERKDPDSSKRRLKYWFDPKPGFDAETQSHFIEVFLADEFQALITSDLNSGVSDATVWNVLRSAGVAGVLLSQGVAAYAMMLGDKVTQNIRNNWRSKIILRTEDLATIAEMKQLAGKTPRYASLGWNLHESAVAVRREKGFCAENLQKTEWTGEFDKMPLFGGKGNYGIFHVPGWAEAFALDDRFIPSSKTMNYFEKGGGGGDNGRLDAERAATWRQEDLSDASLQHGASEDDAVHEEDLMQMGRGCALAFIQRGGGTRVDEVLLNAAGH